MKEDVCKKVKQTIEKHNLIQKGDHIVVGLSGGPDSVCLFHVLSCLKEEYQLTLTAVHVNHMLRAEDADADQCYVQQLCEQTGVACHSFTFDVHALSREWKMTDEEAGRKVRYDSFDQVADMVCAQKIAVAQNQNDQAETILMRLMRGTGTDGLAGIEYIRDGRIIRPLLDVQREEIEAYCMQNKLDPRKDKSNDQPVYTRNRVRLECIPFIQKNFDENIIRHLGKLAKTVQQDKDFLYQVACKAYEERVLNENEVRIPKAVFQKQHIAIQKRMLLYGFAEIGLVQDIETIHLENALKLIAEGRTSAGIDFPGQYRMSIDYQQIVLKKPQRDPDIKNEDKAEVRLAIGETTDISDYQMTVKCTVVADRPFIEPGCEAKVFDLDKIYTDLTLRTRRAGDIISPYGMMGHKKLKAFLIDEKVPVASRNLLPLICAGNEVVWAIGIRTSETFKADKNTKRYLLIELQRH